MRLGRAKFATFLLCFSLACIVPHLLAKKKDKAASSPSDARLALHALNRLTFGPRPGDVQQVMAMGVEQWIELQLHPEKIDDSALNARLEPLRTLRMSTKEIAQEFPDPQEINQVMNGKRPMPSDPARRAIFEVQLARLQDRKERDREEKDRKQDASKNGDSAAAPGKASNDGSPMNGGMNTGSVSNEAAGINNSGDSENTMSATAAPAKLSP